mmetsp:Transcript_120858/g.338374  ORF Transcript_120858/g.338374 Transcript_120858/m.338374 type:complete len:214 (-) Transcript_120858:705-1346(-)
MLGGPMDALLAAGVDAIEGAHRPASGVGPLRCAPALVGLAAPLLLVAGPRDLPIVQAGLAVEPLPRRRCRRRRRRRRRRRLRRRRRRRRLRRRLLFGPRRRRLSRRRSRRLGRRRCCLGGRRRGAARPGRRGTADTGVGAAPLPLLRGPRLDHLLLGRHVISLRSAGPRTVHQGVRELLARQAAVGIAVCGKEGVQGGVRERLPLGEELGLVD